jgi:hypothetical protein
MWISPTHKNGENLPMDEGLHDLRHCSNFVFEVRVEYLSVNLIGPTNCGRLDETSKADGYDSR